MYQLGINFGSTNMSAGIVDDNGTIIAKATTPTLKYRAFDAVIRDMAEMSIALVKKQGMDMEQDIRSIGIASSGIVDKENLQIIYSTNFDLHNIKMKEEICKYINKPLYIENDANCYALAESLLGAAQGYKNSVTLIIGYYIGAGIVVDGKIYRGSFYGSGEVGHQVIVYEGEKCKCGRHGCWEAYASASALVRDARIEIIRHPESMMFQMVNGDSRLMSYDIPFAAAKAGDLWAKHLVYEYTKYVATGLINIINILQPDAIVIGGRLALQGSWLIDSISEIVTNKIYGNNVKRVTKICQAKLDYDAIIIGAALLDE